MASNPGHNQSQMSHPSQQTSQFDDEYEKERAELALQIGIDYDSEKQKFAWFLDQVVNLDLPPGWIKEEDSEGRIVYSNESEDTTTMKHPLINKFRSIFKEILQSDEAGRLAAENFVKAYREKMQALGIEPKNDKKRGKRGPQQGGSHSNLTARSKAGANGPVSLMEQGKSKERYDQLKDMLSKGKAHQTQAANEVDNIQLTEKILAEYRKIYRSQYGAHLSKCPPYLESSDEYAQCDPNEILNAAKAFGVFPNEAYLFWVLRIYASMPLPELWTKNFDAEKGVQLYLDLQTGAKLTVHPCFLWIKEIISYLRELAKQDPSKTFSVSSRMKFQDSLERKFEVDIAALFRQETEGAKNNFNPNLQHTKVDLDLVFDEGKKGKKDFNPNYRDTHFLELANQLKIDINKEVHLMMSIEDFIREREKDERWFFRQTADGQSFWVNHEHKKAVKEYPHLEELRKHIEEARKKLKNEKMTKYKKDGALIRTLFRKYTEETAMRILLQEAKNFVEYFVAHKDLLQEETAAAEKKGYNLSKLTKIIGGEISKSDLLDILFYCPFNFATGFGDLPFGGDSHLLKKFRLMTRHKSTNQDLDLNGAESDGSDITTESAKERRAKIRIPKKLFNVLNKMRAETDELLSKPKEKEFIKSTFDFEQRYDDDEFLDDLDYDKMIEDAERRAGFRKDKKMLNDIAAKKAAKQQGGKLEPLKGGKGLVDPNKKGGNFSGGVIGANDFRSKAVAALGLKYSNVSSKLNLNRNEKVNTEPEKTEEVPLTEEDLERMRQEEAKLALMAEFRKGFAQSMQKHLAAAKVNAGNRTTKEYLMDKLREAQSGPLSKSEGKQMLQKEGKLARLNRGDIREIVNLKSSLKKLKGRDGGNQNFVSLSDPQTSEDNVEDEEGDEEEEAEDVVEELDPEKLKDAIQESDLVFEAREITEEIDMVDENGQMRKTTRKIRKKVPILKKTAKEVATQTEKDENKEASTRIQERRLTKKVLEPIQVYEEIETTGANGEKGKKLVPVMKNLVREIPIESSGGKRKKKKKNLKKVRVDSIDAIHEMEEPSSGRSSLKNFILYQQEGKPVRIKQTRKVRPHEGEQHPGYYAEGTDPNSISLYDMLTNANLFELDREINSKDWRAIENFRSRERAHKAKKKKEMAEDYERRAHSDEENTDISLNNMVADYLQVQVYSPESRKLQPIRERPSSEVKLVFNKEIENEIEETHIRRRRLPPMKESSNNSLLQTIENSQRGQTDQYFYTGVRQPINNKTANFLEDVKRRLFVRKLDEIVIDFLIRQFHELHADTLNTEIDVEEPHFRAQFIKNNRKLITHLRGRLFQNKEFVKSTYTQMYLNILQEDPLRDEFAESNLMNQIRKSPPRGSSVPPLRTRNKSLANLTNATVQTSEQQIQASTVSEVKTSKSPEHNENQNESVMENPDAQGKNDAPVKLPQIGSRKKEQGVKINSIMFAASYGSSQSIQNRQPQVFYTGRVGRTGIPVKGGGLNDRLSGKTKNPLDELKIDMTQREASPKARDNPKFGNLILAQEIARSGAYKGVEAFSIMKIEKAEDRASFAHYVKLFGDPTLLSYQQIVNKIDPPKTVHSYSLMLMAARFGIKIHGDDSDLAWIAYAALSATLPPEFERELLTTTLKEKVIQKLCYMRFGEHPGDLYFKKVIESYSYKRERFFSTLKPEEIKRYAICHSWLKFRFEHNGNIFYFNMMTKEKADHFPASVKGQLQKFQEMYKQSSVSLVNTLLKDPAPEEAAVNEKDSEVARIFMNSDQKKPGERVVQKELKESVKNFDELEQKSQV